MRFIDRKQRDVDLAKRLAETFVVKAFWSDVQNLELPAADAVHDIAVLVQRQRRVESCRSNAPNCQCIDLVFHQRDQR